MSARHVRGVDPFRGYRETLSAPASRWETFCDMQASPQPLTIAELEALAERHPERWVAFLAIVKGEASS